MWVYRLRYKYAALRTNGPLCWHLSFSLSCSGAFADSASADFVAITINKLPLAALDDRAQVQREQRMG